MGKIVIEGELPSLNEYVSKERTNRFIASNMKRKYTRYCETYTRAAARRGVSFDWPCVLHFTWYAKNKRKDPDNIAFAKKFILDGFQQAGFLDNDNFKSIQGFVDDFKIDSKRPRVEIEEYTWETALF